ncbi:MAG: hypothetical protein HKN33_11570 [Pyrinomonadaceae bacterium]|nr:hypothetical protein [Pyrinomonadaceae bacterium]
MQTPYITYMIGYGLYTNHEIDFSSLERSGSKSPPEKYGWDSPVFDEDGNVTPECREALLEHAKAVSARTGIILSIVYSDIECIFVDPEGMVKSSDVVPSLMAGTRGNEEPYELIGLPLVVKDPGATPEDQKAWVNKMKYLQFATIRSIRKAD